MSDINVEELSNVHNRRVQARAEIYDKMYKRCWERIKRLNNRFYAKDMVFRLPPMQPGYPLYNTKCCLAYIVIKLRQQGFFAKYVEPNSIYISWKTLLEKKNYSTRDSSHRTHSTHSTHSAHSHNNHSGNYRDNRDNRDRDKHTSKDTKDSLNYHYEKKYQDRYSYKEKKYDSPPKKPRKTFNPKQEERKEKQRAIHDLIYS